MLNKIRQEASSYARIVDTAGLVRLLLLINLISCIFIGVIFWAAKGWQETTLSLLLMALFSGILLGIQKAGFTQLAGFALYLVVSSVITFNVSIGHGIHDEAMLVYPLMIVFSGLLFGKRSAVLVTAISLAQLILIYIFSQAGIVQPFEGAIEMQLEETITSLVIIMVTGYIVWLVIDIIERAVETILVSERELERAYDHTLVAWAKTLELRKREAPGHSERVSSISTLFAEYIGLDQKAVKALKQGALLHDIGKMGIPEALLLKPTAHDPDESAVMKDHIRLGVDLIKDIPYLEGAREIVAYHHERYDGRGYPDQLQGDQIPIAAQLFALVDCWDSLLRDRPCRKAWTEEKVLAFIEMQAGKKFNPKIVDQFMELINEYDLREN